MLKQKQTKAKKRAALKKYGGDASLLALAYLAFALYWLFLLLSWPPLRGFLTKMVARV